MTNLEKLRSLSVEEMARVNVRSFTYMNGYRATTEFHTTNGHIFGTREEAEEYEQKWLAEPCKEECWTLNRFNKKEN